MTIVLVLNDQSIEIIDKVSRVIVRHTPTSNIPPISTEEKIFKTAVDLFSQKGFHAVSIREIARNVGIKESSIYNHYASKDKILETIFDYYQNQMDKTDLSEEKMEKKIKSISFEEFWTKGLSEFHKTTEYPIIEKINNIILLEMFRAA